MCVTRHGRLQPQHEPHAHGAPHECAPLFTMKDMKVMKRFWLSDKTFMLFMRFMVNNPTTYVRHPSWPSPAPTRASCTRRASRVRSPFHQEGHEGHEEILAFRQDLHALHALHGEQPDYICASPVMAVSSPNTSLMHTARLTSALPFSPGRT